MNKILSLICVPLGIIFFCLLGAGVFAAGESSGDITDTSFDINVGTFTPGGTSLIGTGSGETVNNVLLTVLEKLIVVFGVFAALIMTVGAGYMIIYHGQDEFLSKGKSIFMSGIIALAVALSAGVIVKLFAYLLY